MIQKGEGILYFFIQKKNSYKLQLVITFPLSKKHFLITTHIKLAPFFFLSKTNGHKKY